MPDKSTDVATLIHLSIINLASSQAGNSASVVSRISYNIAFLAECYIMDQAKVSLVEWQRA